MLQAHKGGDVPDTNTALNPLPLADNDGGALNLTRVTGLGAALVAVLTTFNGSWKTIFGASAPDWAKPVVIMSVIAAFAVVAAADILGRGYAAGRRGDIIPMPEGLTAVYTPGPNQDVSVSAVRFRKTEDDDSEFLVVKDDNTAIWAGRDELDFSPPAHRSR
jgi:hypothetical protein